MKNQQFFNSRLLGLIGVKTILMGVKDQKYPNRKKLNTEAIYHTIIQPAFVCLCVCVFVPYLLRGPLTDLRQTWWVYVRGPPICP